MKPVREDQRRAVAFDLDADSLASLRAALPGWTVEVVNGATASQLSHDWNPGRVDLLVVNAGYATVQTLGLCRFLVFCSALSADSREELAETPAGLSLFLGPPARPSAPLLVLVRPGREDVVRAALAAGADSCLVLPVHSKQLTSTLARARAGNRPGRHTLGLDRAQREDMWRDHGGQG
jgi:hypothetical protein